MPGPSIEGYMLKIIDRIGEVSQLLTGVLLFCLFVIVSLQALGIAS